MKIYILLLLCVSALLATEKQSAVKIDQHSYVMSEKTYDLYGDRGVTLRIYKNSASKQNELLSFILENKSGPCSAKSIQEGYYEIKQDKIFFYSRWERRGKAYDSPTGERIQIYKLGEDGSFQRLSSKLYIERTRKNYDKESGMKYLFTVPKTTEEKAALAHYVAKVEKIFDGTFVFGEEAKKVEKEVHDALQRKQKKRWQ